MKISGLYQLIARKGGAAKWQREKAATATDPNVVHEANLSASELEAEVKKILTHAKSNEELIQKIEQIIQYLLASPIQSADRTLARRELESASMRLRRELGDKPH